jgi:hypothetical protein
VVPDQSPTTRDLTIWTTEFGAVVKSPLRFQCLTSNCGVSRPYDALDYRAAFQWVALAPSQGTVFLTQKTLDDWCV